MVYREDNTVSFDPHGPFLFVTNEIDMSEEEAKQEEERIQEQLCELMYLQQQYHGIIKEQRYVLRDSKLCCQYGTRYARLDCIEDNGVLKRRFPVLTVFDCTTENIHSFGSCLCPEANYVGRLPMTVASNSREGIAVQADCNVFPHVCVPLIGDKDNWKQIDGDLLVETNAQGYAPVLTDNAVLVCQYGGIISIVEVPDAEEEEKEGQENKLYKLSNEYIDWLKIAEGCTLYPYVNSSDSDAAKAAQTVTIGMGVTFNKSGSNWKAIKEALQWDEEKIKAVINGLWVDGKDYSTDENYQITEEEALDLLNKVAEDIYIPNLNNSIIAYRQQSGDNSIYSQRELEAMFDYSFNSGLSPKNDLNYNYSPAINDPDRIIYYYLRHDQEGAVTAVKKFGNTDKRRRINQMYLFFIGYEFCDHSGDGLVEHRKALGFDK